MKLMKYFLAVIIISVLLGGCSHTDSQATATSGDKPDTDLWDKLRTMEKDTDTRTTTTSKDIPPNDLWGKLDEMEEDKAKQREEGQ